MFSAGVIAFRESLEAVLVVGIILSFLQKTERTHFTKFVWQGLVGGLLCAIVVGFLVKVFFGGLHGEQEQIFEGILMFVTTTLLTWMIIWVHRQRQAVKDLKEKVAFHADRGYGLGISLLVASSIFREGTETALYLQASSVLGATNQFIGVILGILLALILGYSFFSFAMKIRLTTIFNITSVFLVLFAAGLVSHGIHEFQEASLLPIFSFDPIINLSNILDHKSFFGSFLRVLFGYTSKPTILEITSYSSYMVFIYWLKRLTDRLLAVRV